MNAEHDDKNSCQTWRKAVRTSDVLSVVMSKGTCPASRCFDVAEERGAGEGIEMCMRNCGFSLDSVLSLDHQSYHDHAFAARNSHASLSMLLDWPFAREGAITATVEVHIQTCNA